MKKNIFLQPLSLLLLVSSLSYATQEPSEHCQVLTTSNTTTTVSDELSQEEAEYLENLLKEEFPLHDAVRTDNERAVRLLIRSKKVDVNEKNYDGLTPLRVAVIRNRLSAAQALIEAGADVNAPDKWDNTLLHEAAQWGHLSIIRALIKAGAHVNEKNRQDYTPVHNTVISHWIDSHMIHCVVQLLIKTGADVNEKNSDGRTALHLASERGHHSVVQILIAAKAGVNEKDILGMTPLHRAVTLNGNIYVVQSLVEAGADVNIIDNEGKTPLENAQKHDSNYGLLMHLPELKNCCRQERRISCLNFLAALHQRCGASSTVSTLSPYVIRHICSLLLSSFISSDDYERYS